MSRRTIGALGFALALVSTTAFAQVAVGASHNTTPPDQAQPDPSGQRVLVMHDLDGYHPCRQGDNACKWAEAGAYDAYRTAHPQAGMMSAADAINENRQMCSETGGTVRESIDIMVEIYDERDGRGLGPELDGMRSDLVKLASQERTATKLRRGTEIGSSILSFLFGPVYGGMNTLGNISNEAQGSAHDAADMINRNQSDLNARQSELQLRAMLVSMRANITWAKLVQPECLQDFPDETLGPPGSAAPTGWGYWNQTTAQHR